MAATAQQFLSTLTPRSRATIVALSGDLGGGKTTFTQEIAKILGITASVTSPTFILENIYTLSGKKWERLIHIDAYRLKSADELRALGWDDIAADPKNLIVLEWPERVPELLPEDTVKISFDINSDMRIITFND